MDIEVLNNKLITYMLVEFYWDDDQDVEYVIYDRFETRLTKYLTKLNIKEKFNNDDIQLLYTIIFNFYKNTNLYPKLDLYNQSIWFHFYREKYLNLRGLKYIKDINSEIINTQLDILYSMKTMLAIDILIHRPLIEYAIEISYIYKMLQPVLYEKRKEKYTIMYI